jgi:hypothetical protein
MGFGEKMMEHFCERLTEVGFRIFDSFLDREHFGNVIIHVGTNSGIRITITKDRGIWDCTVQHKNANIPIVLILATISGIPSEDASVTFESEKAMLDMLTQNKSEIEKFTKRDFQRVLSIWRRGRTNGVCHSLNDLL